MAGVVLSPVKKCAATSATVYKKAKITAGVMQNQGILVIEECDKYSFYCRKPLYGKFMVTRIVETCQRHEIDLAEAYLSCL